METLHNLKWAELPIAAQSCYLASGESPEMRLSGLARTHTPMLEPVPRAPVPVVSPGTPPTCDIPKDAFSKGTYIWGVGEDFNTFVEFNEVYPSFLVSFQFSSQP